VAQAFDDPECGGVAFVGRAGFGKTRLAAQALEMACDLQMASASVRATKSASDIPFAALAPLFVDLDLPGELNARLFRTAADEIDRRRSEQRLALLIDDAQELDDASAALIDQLVDRSSIFIILTLRLGEREANSVVDLLEDHRIRRISVGALAPSALRTLAVLAVGGPLDGASLQAIVEASGGNVLFLRELIQGAVESGALRSNLGLWHLEGSLAHSPRLRDLIEQRLTGLSELEREALELVALGDPVTLAVAEQLVPLHEVERLESRGLLDVSGGPLPELRLNHPLYGEVVRAHLPSLRRARLCRSLADAAEASGDVKVGDALRIAVWRLDGGGEGRLETTLAAARAALRTEDYRLAVRLGQAAWERWPSVDTALVLGDALDFVGRCREVDELLGTAAALATNDRQRTNVAIRRASALFRSLGEADEADGVIETAMVQVADPNCRRELVALRGNNLLLTGDVAQAVMLDESLLLEPGDAAFAEASMGIGTALAMAGRTAEAIAHTTKALSVRNDLSDDKELSAIGVYLVAQALAQVQAGALDEGAAIGLAGYEVAVEKNNVDGQAWFASILGLAYLAQGRSVSSRNMFREAATLFGSLNHPGQRWGLGGIALASGQLGDYETGAAAIHALDELEPTAVHLQDVGILRGRAWTAMSRGELTTARNLLWEAVERAEHWGQHATAAEALHDLVRTGMTTRAAEELERLGDKVDGAFMGARMAFARAARTGSLEDAAQATDRFEEIGALLFAAEASMLERELASTSGLHRRAAAAATRTERLLEACEGAKPVGFTGADGARLSDREREVALLAAQDMTSREIAERLFVSVRTVDNHLQRVYMKLGVSRRSELARRLTPTHGTAD